MGSTFDGVSEPSNDRAAKPAKGSPQGAADRVSTVHSQARPTFALCALSAVVAAVLVPIPNRTGLWLPLHVFMVGTLLGAIVAATQLLAVTWSSSPAPSRGLANAQRVTLFAGVAMVAIGRELSIDSSAGKALIGVGGTSVIITLILLIVSMIQVRRGAVTDRYAPAILGYVISASFGIVGIVLGAALASGAFGSDFEAVRGVHLTANALGLVGIVIASTLPFFLATQARMKMAPFATSKRITASIVLLAAATTISLVGWVTSASIVAAIGAWSYAAILAGSVSLYPRVRRKQFDWAGPRLAQMATGFLWWIVALVLLGVTALTGGPSINMVLVLMVLGGYAQIVSASLNYFAPVITAGKRKPGEGLRLTRSWVSFGAGNIAAIGVITRVRELAAAAVAVWLCELAYRLIILARFSRETNADGANVK